MLETSVTALKLKPVVLRHVRASWVSNAINGATLICLRIATRPITFRESCLSRTARMPLCLSIIQPGTCRTYFWGLANLLADGLPFVGLIFTNGFLERSHLRNVSPTLVYRSNDMTSSSCQSA
jgi:hypothetical protein